MKKAINQLFIFYLFVLFSFVQAEPIVLLTKQEPVKKISSLQKIKQYLIKHKIKVVGLTVTGLVAALWWKFFKEAAVLPQGKDALSDGKQSIQNANALVDQKKIPNKKPKEKRVRQQKPNIADKKPVQGGIYTVLKNYGNNKASFYQGCTEYFQRGCMFTSTPIMLIPEIDKYTVEVCKTVPQPDCSSCGQRALINAMYIMKALREGKELGDELCPTAEDKAHYQYTLNELFTEVPSTKWTAKRDFEPLLDATKKISKKVNPYAFDTLKQELDNHEVADFIFLTSLTKDPYKYVFESYSQNSHYHDIPQKNVDRFRQGIPQVYIIYVPGKHWITVKIELKKNEETGKEEPKVTTFDGMSGGEGWNHSNNPMINAILYILTDGTKYQVGAVEKGESTEEFETYNLCKGNIKEALLRGATFSELFKKEQLGYQEACRELGIAG